MRHAFIFFLLFLSTFAAPARADDEDWADLRRVKDRVEAVEALRADGTITDAQATAGTKRFLREAGNAAGRPVTAEELGAIPDPTTLERAARWLTFANAVTAMCVIAGSFAFLFLFRRAVAKLLLLLAQVPARVYQAGLTLGGAGLAEWGAWGVPDPSWGVGLTGSILFGAGFLWTALDQEKIEPEASWISACLALAWICAAVAYGSTLIGTMAVAAFMDAVGSSAVAASMIGAFGFEDKDVAPRVAAGAFGVGALAAAGWIVGGRPEMFSVFSEGAERVVDLVGFPSLIMMASVHHESRVSWTARQLLFVGTAIVALVVGARLDMPGLVQSAASYALVYAALKPFDIRGSRIWYAAATLTLSVVTYQAVEWANTHADQVAAYLFFY